MQKRSAVPRFEALGPGHDRAGFDCGEPALNDYLQKTARQHAEKGISRSFVLVNEPDPRRIIGFFTLAMCEVEAPLLPPETARKLPPGRLPGARLARMAVRLDEQGRGYGDVVLVEAIRRVAEAGRNVGCVGLFVDAKSARARAFYERFGFLRLRDRKLELFLPFATVLEWAGD
jgi:GNAT superfamily N-acetyltransferase